MFDRNHIQLSYRYGFNGMEKDDEHTQGKYDFGARLYDARLGRWLSVDAVTKSHRTPYDGLDNNPIAFIDPDGNDDVFTNSEDGTTTIIKTKDKFDRDFVDGKQVGENLEQGWGIKTCSEAKVIDLTAEWSRQYLYDDGRIIGLAAHRSNSWFDTSEGEELDTETPASQLEFGVIDLGGGFSESSFYQTFYSDFNPGEKAGNKLDGNSIGIYPDQRVESGWANDTGIPFAIFMGDNPHRTDFLGGEEYKNMVWNGNTTLLYKKESGEIKSLMTIEWGFTMKNSVATRKKATLTDSPSKFHTTNMPTSGDISPTSK
jgi:RHS repeat-associated protein